MMRIQKGFVMSLSPNPFLIFIINCCDMTDVNLQQVQSDFRQNLVRVFQHRG